MKLHSSPIAHTILQNLSLKPNLMKRIWSSDSGAVANSLMMRGVTVPTLSSASSGAVSFVGFFAGGRSHLATFNAKYRSKISLYFLLLCVIIANGEIFKFDGGLCFMLSHLTMVANPCSDFSRSSTCIFVITLSSNADEWGTLVTDASLSSGVQSRPIKTGHPTRAY